jgi:hypothetical protein
MAAPAHTSTIYVQLLDEGTPVWRPVSAELVSGETYRIVGDAPDPGTERWEFMPGKLVRCRIHRLSGGDSLVAYARASA